MTLLLKSLAPATVNRTCTVLKAALNLAADQDERIVSRRAWEVGRASIPDAEEARDVILPDGVVRNLLAEAQAHSAEFGLLVEVTAVTGARVSQRARLSVEDLQDGTAPRLMIPASRKGKGAKAVLRRPVPISSAIAEKLRAAAEGRPATAPILTKPSGEPWKKSDHSRLFARAVQRCGLDPAEVTIYALRHSNIVRSCLPASPSGLWQSITTQALPCLNAPTAVTSATMPTRWPEPRCSTRESVNEARKIARASS